MDYQKNIEKIPQALRCAVTLGKFDGLHRGHKKLIQRVLEKKEQGLSAAVFAFDQSNRMILSHEERRAKLETMGVDLFLECPLNEKLRHMPPEVFVKEILVDRLHVGFWQWDRIFGSGMSGKEMHSCCRKWEASMIFRWMWFQMRWMENARSAVLM